MRSAGNLTSSEVGIQQWNSPLPYLFGGLALMLGLIAIALVILACSYKSPEANEGDEEKSNRQDKRVEMGMEMEPKIVVIMAGDLTPSYLAYPLPPPPPPPSLQQQL